MVAVFLCIGEFLTLVELSFAFSTPDRRLRIPFLAILPSRESILPFARHASQCIRLCFPSLCTRTPPVLCRFFPVPCIPRLLIFPTPLVRHLIRIHSCQHANKTLFSSAMGKSRSATVVIAYLMQEHNINPSEALSHIRQARSICEPNEGFMKQLELYGEMHTPENVEQTPAYQRWVYQREIELSRACGQAPEADKIRFEDEHVTDQDSGFELRCRKCR